MSSFTARKMSRSARGRPIRRRKTRHGRGTANSSWRSHEPRAANSSTSSFTRPTTSSSSRAIFLGAKRGSRIRRYFTCWGGSIIRGMRGRMLPRSMGTSLQQYNADFRRASSTCSRRVNSVNMSSIRITGCLAQRAGDGARIVRGGQIGHHAGGRARAVFFSLHPHSSRTGLRWHPRPGCRANHPGRSMSPRPPPLGANDSVS